MAALLSARELTKRFGGLVALDRLTLEIEERSIHAIIGPNGSGKTTFFNCVTGFYRPDGGTIVLREQPIDHLAPDLITRRGVSRTYQNIRLFANMTAIENVLVGMHPHLASTWFGALARSAAMKREERDALERARELLRWIGLGGRGDLLAKNLPYGDQRRLEIARALASRPALLLLDEPTAGMNPRETAQMMELIASLRAERGITILLIEHQMRVVLGICDRVSALDHGVKIAEGTPRQVHDDPHVIEAYLGLRRAHAAHPAAPVPFPQGDMGA